MNLPAIFFGFLVATFYGAIFHLWLGGRAGKLALYLILSWLGFLLGHIAGDLFNFPLLQLGSLNVGMATVGSLLLMALGRWLSLSESSSQPD